MDTKKHYLISAALILLVGAGGFYGGTLYQKGKSGNGQASSLRGTNLGSSNRQPGSRQGQTDGQQRRLPTGTTVGGGNGFVVGEVIAKDDQSITVKDRDGGSKVIFFSDTTSIGKTTEGVAADLENGNQVVVNGKANDDGTFTAQNIQIRPEGSSGFGPNPGSSSADQPNQD